MEHPVQPVQEGRNRNDKAKDILDSCFNITNLEQGYYLQDCVSRKKQIIPAIMDAMDKK